MMGSSCSTNEGGKSKTKGSREETRGAMKNGRRQFGSIVGNCMLCGTRTTVAAGSAPLLPLLQHKISF